MAFPCIKSSRMGILGCFSCSLSFRSSSLWAYAVKIPYKKRISNRIDSGCKDGFRLPLHGKVGDERQSSTSFAWGFERGGGDWRSSVNGVRTFATSPESPDAENSGVAPETTVEKFLRRGYFAKAAEALENRLTKPEICTADELHYVAVSGTNWRLALWRYCPPPNTPQRNHPLLMLSGIGTNAIGFDLDPSVSMARYMAEAGFDTWILEVRGAGLSKSEEELAQEGTRESKTVNGAVVENKPVTDDGKIDPQTKSLSDDISQEGAVVVSEEVAVDIPEEKAELSAKPSGEGTSWEAWTTATRLSNTILQLSEKLSKLLSRGQSEMLSARFIDSISSLLEDSRLTKGIAGVRERLTSLLEAQQNSSTLVSQIADLRKRLAQLLEDGQGAVSPRVTDLQERLNSTVEEFHKFADLIAKYDWDFDNYLEEDVPAAIEYIRSQSKPVDGKLLSVGHSMGGIVLYALLSTRGSQSGLAGAVALASALDYQCSDTSLKLLLPLADPAQVFNVPLVPLGALMTAVHPLVMRPPYALTWLGHHVSAHNMMKAELFSKLVLNNFGTIPVKLLLHLATVFQPGGLANRDGTVKYKDNIGKVDVPVLAVAADQDLICPPAAVIDTVDLFPKETITYKCFGGENDRHYGHYDVVCSPAAKEEVFPIILDFLIQNDEVKVNDRVKVGTEG